MRISLPTGEIPQLETERKILSGQVRAFTGWDYLYEEPFDDKTRQAVRDTIASWFEEGEVQHNQLLPQLEGVMLEISLVDQFGDPTLCRFVNELNESSILDEHMTLRHVGIVFIAGTPTPVVFWCNELNPEINETRAFTANHAYAYSRHTSDDEHQFRSGFVPSGYNGFYSIRNAADILRYFMAMGEIIKNNRNNPGILVIAKENS